MSIQPTARLRAAAVLGVAFLVSGQLPPPGGSNSFGSIIRPWPPAESSGNFGRFVYGDVTDMPGREVIGLRGGRVYVVVDPSALDGLQRLDSTLVGVQDVAVLPDGGSDLRDAVLTVDPVLGLLVHSYDPALQDFTSVSLDVTWTGVTRLVVGDLDGDGTANDIAGASGQLLLTLVHNGPQSGLQYVPGVTHVTQTPISDVEILDYDADGAPDVAMLTDGGIAVDDAAGVAFPFIPSFAPGGFLAVIPRATAPGDELAWCTEIVGTWYLIVLDATVRGPAVPLTFASVPGAPLQTVVPVGLVPVDLLMDGKLDLVLFQQTVPALLTLTNVGTTNAAAFSNAPADVMRIQLLVDDVGQMGLNGATGAAFAESGEQAWIYAPLDSENGCAVALDADYGQGFAGGSKVFVSFAAEPISRMMDVTFKLPDLDSTLYNAVQVEAFFQCNETDLVDPNGLFNQVLFFPGGNPLPGIPWKATLTLPIPASCVPSSPPFWHLTWRFVHAETSSGTDVIVDDAYRLYTMAVRLSTTLDQYNYLCALPTYLQCYPFEAMEPGTSIGGVVLLDRIPIFGGPPVTPRATVGSELSPAL